MTLYRFVNETPGAFKEIFTTATPSRWVKNVLLSGQPSKQFLMFHAGIQRGTLALYLGTFTVKSFNDVPIEDLVLVKLLLKDEIIYVATNHLKPAEAEEEDEPK